MGSNVMHGPSAQTDGAAPKQILDVALFHQLLLTQSRYRPQSGGFGKVMKLSFQPYKELPEWTPYVLVTLFLVQTVSRIRERNKVQFEGDWNFNVYVSDVVMFSSLALHPSEE